MSTTQKLLDAAEHRMRRGGYNAVSFRDLASDTNIKSSSVHYHYPKKEDLGIALVKRYSERFFKALEEKSADAKTPQEKLQAYTSVYREALQGDDAICLCGLLGAEIPCLPSEVTAAVQDFFNANIDWLSNMLPGEMNRRDREAHAAAIVAGHQGAMMLSTAMNQNSLFDLITAGFSVDE